MIHKQLGVDTAILVCSTRGRKYWLVYLEINKRRRYWGLAFRNDMVRAFQRSYILRTLDRDDPQEEPREETEDFVGLNHDRPRRLYKQSVT